MSKFISNTLLVFLLFALLLALNTPAPNLEYGINEYKRSLFALIYTITAFLVLFIFIQRKKNVLFKNHIDFLILSILIYNTIRLYFQNNQTEYNLLNLWISCGFYYISVSIFRLNKCNQKLPKITLYVISVALLFQLMVGVLQYFGKYNTYNNYYLITGTFINPGPYSIFLACSGVYIFLNIFLNKKLYSSALIFSLSILFLLTIAMLFYLLSRAAIISTTISLLCFFYYRYRKQVSLTFKLLSTLIIILICIFSYFVKKDSADGRIVIWKISKSIVDNAPIYGIGFNRYSHDYNMYQAEYFKQNPNLKKTEGVYVGNTIVAFNDMYQVLCEQGIIGLIFVLLIGYYVISYYFLLTFKNSITNTLQLNQIHLLFFSFLVLFLSSLATDVAEHFQLLITSVFLLAFISSKYDSPYFHKIKRSLWLRLFLFFITAAIYVSVFNVCYKIYKYHIILLNAKNKLNANYYLSDKELFLFSNDFFAANKSEALIHGDSTLEAIDCLEKAKLHSSHWKIYVTLGILYASDYNYTKAENNLLVVTNMIPNLVYPKYLLSKVYLKSNQKEKWLALAQAILCEKEKIPSKKVDEIKREIKKLLEGNN